MKVNLFVLDVSLTFVFRLENNYDEKHFFNFNFFNYFFTANIINFACIVAFRAD